MVCAITDRCDEHADTGVALCRGANVVKQHVGDFADDLERVEDNAELVVESG